MRFSSLSPLVFSDQSEREEHLQFDFVPPPAEVSSFPVPKYCTIASFPFPERGGKWPSWERERGSLSLVIQYFPQRRGRTRRRKKKSFPAAKKPRRPLPAEVLLGKGCLPSHFSPLETLPYPPRFRARWRFAKKKYENNDS